MWIASGRPAPRYAATGVVFVMHRLPVELDLRDDVHVRRHHLREERQERADRRVRARFRVREHLHAGDRAVALQAELDLVHHAAAVPHRDHVLGARLGPLHRAAERERGLGDEQVLDHHALLRAEARRRPRGCLRVDQRRDRVPSSIAISSRTPCGPCDDTQIVRPPVGFTRNRDDAADFHRHRRDALVDDASRARRHRRRRAHPRPGRSPSRWRRSSPAPRARTGAPSASAAATVASGGSSS